MAAFTPLGVPPLVSSYPGIDLLGQNCRIGSSVSVFRTINHFPEAQISLGDDVMLFDGVRLLLGEADCKLIIGDRVIINVNGYISGEGGLEIGDDVLIGPHVRILSAGHQIHGGDSVVARNAITYAKIIIDRGAWIAAGVTILEGVHIGAGAVVGAGSVVTHNIPPMAVAIGNPARVLHFRDQSKKQRGILARLGQFFQRNDH
jgi:acetyltransferase-like isoleucine patch superfamily enzyme